MGVYMSVSASTSRREAFEPEKKGQRLSFSECADFENLELKQCNVLPLRMNKSLFQEKTSKDQQQYEDILTPTQVKNRYNVTYYT